MSQASQQLRGVLDRSDALRIDRRADGRARRVGDPQATRVALHRIAIRHDDDAYPLAPEPCNEFWLDGLDIPAILYRPLDASPDTRVPAVVFVHGGPGGQSRLGYDPISIRVGPRPPRRRTGTCSSARRPTRCCCSR